jgi:hypothetical protein
MSVLPIGRSLRQVIPDYDELLHDPAGYLQTGSVVIGPRQMYGLAGLFGLGAAACFGYSVWQQQFDPEAVSIGIGLALGAMIWLGWSLLMRGHELTLLPEGVEIKYRDTTVWCPWRLFNAGGTPFVSDADNPRAGLTLPVDPEAIPFVVLRRDDAPVAHGVEVKARQFHFTGANEVVLPARYELRTDELGQLLMQLGGRLGHLLPKGAPPPEAYHLEDLEADALPEPDGAGWVRVHLTHLAFPPQCCSCLADTRQTMRFHVDARLDWFMQIFTQQLRGTVIPIPVCESCHEAIRRRQNQVSSLMMPVGALTGMAFVACFALLAQIHDGPSLSILGLLAVAVGALGGFLLGVRLGRRLPAELRHFSPTQGTVSIRFRNPRYGVAIWERMRERVRAAQRPLR